MPEISVIIPTRNRSGMVPRAVRSAFAQGGADLEVIVVDDGSTDETRSVLAGLEDPRLRVLAVDHGGVAAARNHGVAAAQGEWVAFLDDDDYWAPEKLAQQLAAARASGANFVYCDAYVVDRDGAIAHTLDRPASVRKAELYEHNVVGPPSGVLVSAEAVRACGGFDTAFSIFADWDLYLRVLEEGSATAVRAPLFAYRMHGQNMQFTDIDRLAEEFAALRRKHADGARELGVEFGGAEVAHWLASCFRETGRMREAARVYLGTGLKRGDPKDLARGVLLAALGDRAPRHFRRPKASQLAEPYWMAS